MWKEEWDNAKLLFEKSSNEERLRDLHLLCRWIYIDLRKQTMVDLHTHALELQVVWCYN